MEMWREAWCIYNSVAFAPIAAIGLLGAFRLVVPALITVTARSATQISAPSSQVRFRKARRWLSGIGVFTLIATIGTPLLYSYVFTLMNGDTCPETALPGVGDVARVAVPGLYAMTLLTATLTGTFYLRWRNLQPLLEKLQNSAS
jgi:hypothetical protein